MHLSSVVLPPPDEPITHTRSPFSMFKLMSVRTSATPNLCVSFETRIMPLKYTHAQFLESFDPMFLTVAAIVNTALLNQTFPISLKFSPGETLKYATSINVVESRNPGTLRVNGTHMVTIKVSAVKDGKSTMNVSYSDPTAEAFISGLPASVPKEQKDQIVAQSKLGMKNSLGGPGRSQIVNPRGRTTYFVKGEKARTITISNGAFLMAILPETAPTMNQKWTVPVAFPDANSAKPLQVTYKLVGTTIEPGEQGLKLSLTATDHGSRTDRGATLSTNLELSGWIVIGAKSGKVLKGEFTRTIRATFTVPKQPAQKSTTKVTQSYKKV